jgi:hypothetical protein
MNSYDEALKKIWFRLRLIAQRTIARHLGYDEISLSRPPGAL